MINLKIQVTIFLLTILSLKTFGQANERRTTLGIKYAKAELKEALTNKKEKQILVDQIITEKETAISISETILFKIYGKNNIIEQRPYEVNKVNNYWILNGTLPENMDGGTFLIIINSTNGQIIKLTHGK